MAKIFLTTVTLLLLIFTYLHSISAIMQDLGRHIKTGEIIVTTLQIPKTNLYAYTYPSFPFINHHWGSEVIFYSLYKIGGLSVILLSTALASITAFLLLYRYIYKKTQFFALTIVSFLTIGMLYERTDVRPEAFSFFFFSLFLLLLFKNKHSHTKWIYVLIPLQLLWTNVHIYFIVGIITIFLFFLDACITYRKQLKKIFPLFSVLILSTLASFINPHGIEGAFYPFRVFENYGYAIEENQNIFFLWEVFQKRTIVFFAVSVLLLFTTLFARVKHTHPIDWFLAICFTVLGCFQIRNMPLFALGVFIPFASHFSYVLSPLSKKLHGWKYILSTLCLGLLYFWQLSYIQTTKPFAFSTPIGAEKAVDFIKNHDIKGPYFNNFDIGSYFLFRMYPQEMVFVDGRPEAYPASFFQQIYIPMQEDQKRFQKVEQKYHFNAIFFAHTDQTPWAGSFLRFITNDSSWKIVYLDESIIILVKNSNKNKTFSKRELSSFTLSSNTTQSLYQLFSFYQKIGHEDGLQTVANTLLQKNPTDCVALSFFAHFFARTQQVEYLPYSTRFQSQCL